MKTFLVQLQESVGIQYNLRDILIRLTDEEVITEINLFAKNVATEALNNASENAELITDYEYDECVQSICSDSIKNENNIPKL